MSFVYYFTFNTNIIITSRVLNEDLLYDRCAQYVVGITRCSS